ncbi:MAG: tetratricopeptide repeat protein [candidate division Zixibacteria bacterium]|nr:tetratricopeptide repeat protein [candidate division Zixibacteria bacterium]
MTVVIDMDDRIEKCKKILNEDPNSQIFAALAEAYRKKGELDKAFRICQNGLKIHPSYGSAHVVMSKINLDRGLYDWAEAEVQKAVEIDGHSRAIDLLMAEISLYKGDYARAVRLLKDLRQHDPNNAHIQKLLDIALKIPEQKISLPGAADEPTVVAATVTESESVPETSGPTELGTSDVLRLMMTLPSMKGALFVNPEGLVVEAQWLADMDAGTCAATLAELNRLNQDVVRASFGSINAVLIETAGPVFYLVQFDLGMFVFVGETDINLGTLRMKVAGLLENFAVERVG